MSLPTQQQLAALELQQRNDDNVNLADAVLNTTNALQKGVELEQAEREAFTVEHERKAAEVTAKTGKHWHSAAETALQVRTTTEAMKLYNKLRDEGIATLKTNGKLNRETLAQVDATAKATSDEFYNTTYSAGKAQLKALDTNTTSETTTHTTQPKELNTMTHATTNYNTLTVSQLKSECKALGLKCYSKLKKAQLIELLNTHPLAPTDIVTTNAIDLENANVCVTNTVHYDKDTPNFVAQGKMLFKAENYVIGYIGYSTHYREAAVACAIEPKPTTNTVDLENATEMYHIRIPHSYENIIDKVETDKATDTIPVHQWNVYAPACSIPTATIKADVSTVEVCNGASVRCENKPVKPLTIKKDEYTLAVNDVYKGERRVRYEDLATVQHGFALVNLKKILECGGYSLIGVMYGLCCMLPEPDTTTNIQPSAAKKAIPTAQPSDRTGKNIDICSAKDHKSYTGKPQVSHTNKQPAVTQQQLRTYNQAQAYGNMSPRHQAGSRANLYANSKARQVQQRTGCAVNTYTRGLGDTERQAIRNLKEFGNTAKTVANNAVAFTKGLAEGLRGGVNARGERVNYNETRMVERPKLDRKAFSY